MNTRGACLPRVAFGMAAAMLLSVCFSWFCLVALTCHAVDVRQSDGKLKIAIIGSGISGTSTAYFLSNGGKDDGGGGDLYEIHVYERSAMVGGRVAMVNLSSYGGHVFESGASIIHIKNRYMKQFAAELGLRPAVSPVEGRSLGIFDGQKFVLKLGCSSSSAGGKSWIGTLSKWKNAGTMGLRYGGSLIRLRSYVKGLVEQFESFYDEDLPAFTRVEDLLQHAKLYDLTQKQLKDVLEQANISPLLMDELLTAIVRINYGQSLTISGLAGAIGLCGSGADLWAVDGGNRQVPEGLLRKAGAIVHLGEGVEIVRRVEGGKYDVITRHGDSEQFDVVVIATPLDEGALQLEPPIALPARKLQHTHTTFVVGCVDHKFFNLSRESDLPDTIATMENPTIPFSSIGLLMRFENGDGAFKVFSRQRPSEELLDKMFRRRLETIRIDWAAYPLYKTPEEFAPFLLDDHHLYYVNAFENAASTVETMAVAAKNVAKLIVKRLSDRTQHRHNVASTMDLSSDSSYELKSEL